MSAITHAYPPSFIPFNQSSDIIQRLDSTIHRTLLDFNHKYDGLCELICNRILIDDDLGRGRDENYLKDRVTIERLNEERITTSHLLDVFSIFHRAIAYLFGIHPDNIFSIWDQWHLVDNTGAVNTEMLQKGLDDIEDGETLKIEVFLRGCFTLSGHSLLIKKLESNNYIFFDPNNGEYRGLAFQELTNKFNEQLGYHGATNLFITRGSDYLRRLS